MNEVNGCDLLSKTILTHFLVVFLFYGFVVSSLDFKRHRRRRVELSVLMQFL